MSYKDAIAKFYAGPILEMLKRKAPAEEKPPPRNRELEELGERLGKLIDEGKHLPKKPKEDQSA